MASGNSVDIVYSDEDKIDTRGNHFELYAKPDFAPELLLTQMYLCHFTVFRKEIVDSIGGFRPRWMGRRISMSHFDYCRSCGVSCISPSRCITGGRGAARRR